MPYRADSAHSMPYRAESANSGAERTKERFARGGDGSLGRPSRAGARIRRGATADAEQQLEQQRGRALRADTRVHATGRAAHRRVRRRAASRRD